MIRMSDRGRERIEEYVGEVRSSLAGHPDVDADEVARDVRSHVDEALTEYPEPVGEDDVETVLGRLGSPRDWVPGARVGWRGALERIRRGPDDWRLAYLCIGLTAVGLLAAPIGGILLLVPAFVLARGTIALVRERGEPLGAQRWLIYPVLVLVYIPLAALVLTLPLALSPIVFATGGLIEFLDAAYPEPGTPEHFVRSVGWTMAATGAWWAALGGLVAARPNLVRTAFRPFVERFRRSRAWGLVLAGVVLSLSGIAVIAFG